MALLVLLERNLVLDKIKVYVLFLFFFFFLAFPVDLASFDWYKPSSE
jgi:hypothetical protein